MIVTLTLNPSLDYVMELPVIAPGQVNRSAGEKLYPGGKGINVSLMLHRLGIPSRCLGFSAGETGALLRRMLQKEGVNPEFIDVKLDSFTRINVKVQGDFVTELNGNGPRITDEDWKQLFSLLDTLCRDDILVLSGRFPADSQWLLEKVKQLRDKGIRLTVDSSGAAFAGLLELSPELAKPNLAELEEWVGMPLPSMEQRIRAARTCWQSGSGFGARRLLLSMGGEGALLFWDDGTIRYLAAPKGNVISPVGAGDSMLAGCLAGMAQGLAPDDVLRLAVGCGSATAFSSWLAEAPLVPDGTVESCGSV